MEKIQENMKNHHIMWGLDPGAALKWSLVGAKKWSSSAVLGDEKIRHFHLERKWQTFLFSKFTTNPKNNNFKTHQLVMKQLGYKDNEEPLSAQTFLSDYVANDEVTFSLCPYYSQFGKVTKKDFLSLISKNRYLAEWIRPDKYRRVFADIDGKHYAEVVNAFNEKFTIDGKLPEIAISGSYGRKLVNGKLTEEKYHSYHIVLPDFYFPDKDSMTYFKIWAASIGCDPAVYNANNKLKCVNQKKHKKEKDDRIQKIIMDDNTEHHLVQLIDSELEGKINCATDEWNLKFKEGLDDEQVSAITNIVSQRSQARRTTGVHEIKQINEVEIPLLDINRDSALDILLMFKWKKGYRLPGQVWRNIVRWFCRAEATTYEEFRIWDKKWEEFYPGEGTTEAEYNKIFNTPKEKHYPASRRQIREYLTKHYGVELKPRYLTEMKKVFFKRNESYKGITPLVVQEKYIQLHYLDDAAKFYLLCVSMGAGKTFLAIEYLRKQHPDKSFCFITTRITQAQGIMGRTDDAKLGVYLYSDAGDEKHIILMKKDRLCCEIESLHNVLKRRYDFVILDEFESVRNTFKDNECHGINYTKNYKALVKLVQEAEKVFVMDAYLHTWTIDWLRMVDNKADPVKDFQLIMRYEKEDLIKKQVYLHHSTNIFRNEAVKDLKAGKKVYMFYPYASGSETKKDIINFMERLLEQAGLKKSQGLAYYGKLDKALKEKLSQVNDTWSVTQEYLDRKNIKSGMEWWKKWAENKMDICDDDLIKLVVTNSCLTVGTSCDLKGERRFDVVYLLANHIVSPRQVIQSSMRPRHTKSPIIHLLYIDDFEKYKAIKDKKTYTPKQLVRPSLNGNEPDHFTLFIDSIFIEHKANGLPLLLHFMRTTGYKIHDLGKKNMKQLSRRCKQAEMKTLREREDVNCFDWMNIENIDLSTYSYLDSKVRNNKSDTWEHLAVEKFNVFRHFTDKYKEASSIYWKKQEILEALLILVYNDDIFNRRVKITTGYNKKRIIMKDREIRQLKKLYNKAVVYNGDERCFDIRDDKLTEEDKKDIWSSFVLDTIDKDFNYFKMKSDLIIRKRIIEAMFGKKCLEKISNNASRRKLEFCEKFEKQYLTTAVNGLKYINSLEFSSFSLDGTCHILESSDDEDEEEEMLGSDDEEDAKTIQEFMQYTSSDGKVGIMKYRW